MKDSYILGNSTVAASTVFRISSDLSLADYLGAVMVRWGINRNNYRVNPGLYSIGSPDPQSEVFVTANYKLSFDALRKNLSGMHCWVLVLDTKGINVWCAAGKGTFGTDELVKRTQSVSLDKVVNHKRIILPQLGATGIAAHKVKEITGFNVHYGPVRAEDIKKFIEDGYRASGKMRKVTFRFNERLKLIPNDLLYGRYYLLGAILILFLISGLSRDGLSYKDFSTEGGPAIINIFMTYLSGIVITPLLLPYIPSRAFSMKGFYIGTIMFFILLGFNLTGSNIVEILSWFLIVSSLSSFLAMNFTGSSTFTSLSGVKKEMKISLPLQIIFSVTGIILQIIGKLFIF